MKLFLSEQAPYPGKSKRDKFLSRVFGIFNEEIVRIWCKNKNSPFIDLGRPTVYDPGGHHYTLDFLLENEKGEKFVGEMKCEIEYQKYRYFIPAHIIGNYKYNIGRLCRSNGNRKYTNKHSEKQSIFHDKHFYPNYQK